MTKDNCCHHHPQRILPKTADHRGHQTQLLQWHLPPLACRGPAPSEGPGGFPRPGLQASFRPLCWGRAWPLATYPDAGGGRPGRCWRLRYSPDAARAPSRVAMARRRGRGRQAGGARTPALSGRGGWGHLHDPTGQACAPPPRRQELTLQAGISKGQQSQLQIERILFARRGGSSVKSRLAWSGPCWGGDCARKLPDSPELRGASTATGRGAPEVSGCHLHRREPEAPGHHEECT